MKLFLWRSFGKMGIGLGGQDVKRENMGLEQNEKKKFWWWNLKKIPTLMIKEKDMGLVRFTWRF